MFVLLRCIALSLRDSPQGPQHVALQAGDECACDILGEVSEIQSKIRSPLFLDINIKYCIAK